MYNFSTLLRYTFFYELLLGRKYRFIRHAVSLLIIILMFYSGLPVFIKFPENYLQFALITSFIILFYINLFWLVPGFLLRGKLLTYIFFIAGLIILGFVPFTIVQQNTNHYLSVSRKEVLPAPGFVFFTFQMSLVVGASAAISLFQQWTKDTLKIHDLETSTIRSELEQLRNQISPHFLFNMLNNANVLTRKDPQKASEVLIKLSDILRYQLYDCARAHVLLTSEIHFLNDFLNLENIRREHFDFFISQEGDMTGIQLPPMLFITFVENAVKHNADPQNASYVYVYFSAGSDKLIFQCINSKPGFKNINSHHGGLGLVNVQRRLNLLYPENHTLCIQEDQDKYHVTLTIDL
jgi:sensor histidine kinase YesM